MLSKNFEPTQYQEAGKRRSSEAFDKKINAKIGYTPNETNEYALGFVNQQLIKTFLLMYILQAIAVGVITLSTIKQVYTLKQKPK